MSIADIVKNLNMPVIHNGSPYRLTGCIMRLRGTEIFYQVELRDESGAVNSLVITLPEEVEDRNEDAEMD